MVRITGGSVNITVYQQIGIKSEKQMFFRDIQKRVIWVRYVICTYISRHAQAALGQ